MRKKKVNWFDEKNGVFIIEKMKDEAIKETAADLISTEYYSYDSRVWDDFTVYAPRSTVLRWVRNKRVASLKMAKNIIEEWNDGNLCNL